MMQFVYVVEPNPDTGPNEPWVFEREEDAKEFAETYGDVDDGLGGHPHVSEQSVIDAADAQEFIAGRWEERTGTLSEAQLKVRHELAHKWTATAVESTADPEIVCMFGLIGGDVQMDMTYVHRDGRRMCSCLRGEAEFDGLCEPCYSRYCEARSEMG